MGATGSALVRLLLTAAVLGVPTFLMGGTLPAAVRSIETAEDGPRRAEPGREGGIAQEGTRRRARGREDADPDRHCLEADLAIAHGAEDRAQARQGRAGKGLPQSVHAEIPSARTPAGLARI